MLFDLTKKHPSMTNSRPTCHASLVFHLSVRPCVCDVSAIDLWYALLLNFCPTLSVAHLVTGVNYWEQREYVKGQVPVFFGWGHATFFLWRFSFISFYFVSSLHVCDGLKYRVAQKSKLLTLVHIFAKYWPIFSFFHRYIKRLPNIPPRLNCVATLPCKIWIFKSQ